MDVAEVAKQIIKAISKNRYQVNVGITRILNIVNRISPITAEAIINKSVANK